MLIERTVASCSNCGNLELCVFAWRRISCMLGWWLTGLATSVGICCWRSSSRSDQE